MGPERPRPILAPAPLPADVGLVAALPIEVAPLLARFESVRKYSNDRRTVVEGECGGKLVAAIITGPGRASARRGALHLLSGHRPRWIVSAGFAGALEPDLARNDVFLAKELVAPDGRRIPVDPLPAHEQALSGQARRSVPVRWRTGTLLTVDQIVRTAVEKAELRLCHGADAVDMETSEVALLTSERGLRFASVRVVSDDAFADLPPEALSILGPSGSYRLGAAVGAVWKRPSSVKDLLRLREHALAAAERLAVVLPDVFALLA